ncbi:MULTISPECIES: MFS transporter [unclassified Gilliamella]|uniref:MFS transporter n=1 Tax=unclassified Gilliamella TaxID=2685620 RepID=UPI001C6A506C|nr:MULTISPECIES: MFS transporter [unclassified Gilliamella]MCX8601164.1 MFS transporter [Gilliamella sp. B3722]MCX8607318.1 MFS transporter [Gilliamella sp. B3771]MCX8610493.1 MFS transporter [Gilliamella sp. B3891]MCX8612838.1 MFS transporter [Gilliamella sp. B3773]MCX8614747.1 MFS transporter [Gilliamella sp. B3770]
MSQSEINAEWQPVARPLNCKDLKTLVLSSLGGTLEFYDFVIYALYIDTIVKPLFLPHTLSPLTLDLFAWGIFAAGYLVRPVGGIIMAHFGDKVGRKKMFTLSVAMMALPTFIIGILPTYETIGIMAPLLLLIMRMLQGAAIGGEMPGAWVFIAEHVPKQRYGFGVGTLTSGITGGILLGFIVTIIIDLCFTNQNILDYAWRIPFIVGGIFGVISVYLRRFLSETPIFKELAARKAIEKNIPVVTVLKKHKTACMIVALLTWSLSTAIMVGILITPGRIVGGMYHFANLDWRIGGCIAALTLTIGCIISGWLEDKLGTTKTVILSWGGLAIVSLYFYSSLSPDISLCKLYSIWAIFGLFIGSIAMTPIIGTRTFPPAIRYSGLSFSYNLAYALFSAITPTLTIYLLSPDHLLGQYSYLGAGIYISFVALIAVAVGFYPLAKQGWRSESNNR